MFILKYTNILVKQRALQSLAVKARLFIVILSYQGTLILDTAYSIAGKNMACKSSMRAALYIARDMVLLREEAATASV